MSYHIKLSQFEGPLDLLLHLINKAKIDLQDIFISEITQQYLSYMDEIGEVDMDRASDFLNMASTLLFIKSRSLLPRHAEEQDSEEIDPEQDLIEKLRAYKAFKDVSEELRVMQEAAGAYYYRLPEELPDLVSPVVWEDVEVRALYQAFCEILARNKERTPLFEKVEVLQDSYSVRLQTKKILGLLRAHKEIRFVELFEENASAMEIAVTFLALLQLWHTDKLLIDQKTSFGEIFVKAA
jgi:segregation and condensation protein A